MKVADLSSGLLHSRGHRPSCRFFAKALSRRRDDTSGHYMREQVVVTVT